MLLPSQDPCSTAFVCLWAYIHTELVNTYFLGQALRPWPGTMAYPYMEERSGPAMCGPVVIKKSAGSTALSSMWVWLTMRIWNLLAPGLRTQGGMVPSLL